MNLINRKGFNMKKFTIFLISAFISCFLITGCLEKDDSKKDDKNTKHVDPTGGSYEFKKPKTY